MNSSRILIVDDEASQRSVLAGYLRKKRYAVFEAGSALEALERIGKEAIDLVLTDYKMPDQTGFELLKEIRKRSPETAVVLMTAFGTIEGAVDAMRTGAYDYLTKPIELAEIDLLIQRIADRQLLLSENRMLKEQLAEKFSFQGILSQSAEMDSVLNTAGRVAQSKDRIRARRNAGVWAGIGAVRGFTP